MPVWVPVAPQAGGPAKLHTAQAALLCSHQCQFAHLKTEQPEGRPGNTGTYLSASWAHPRRWRPVPCQPPAEPACLEARGAPQLLDFTPLSLDPTEGDGPGGRGRSAGRM